MLENKELGAGVSKVKLPEEFVTALLFTLLLRYHSEFGLVCGE
jgi:hypothetical protein